VEVVFHTLLDPVMYLAVGPLDLTVRLWMGDRCEAKREYELLAKINEGLASELAAVIRNDPAWDAEMSEDVVMDKVADFGGGDGCQ
jgi:hypothetical protein